MRTTRVEPMAKLSLLLTVAAIGLSPFYFWHSGMPQLAHLVMLLAIAANLAIGRFRWVRAGTWLLFFVAYTLIVNLVVYAVHSDPRTLVSSVYYMYNGLVWFHLITLAEKTGPATFLTAVSRVLWVVLTGQIGLEFLGDGRGELRSMGTFNNPNQMANWLIWVAVSIATIARVLTGKWIPGIIAGVLAAVGVSFSASLAALAALGYLCLVYGGITMASFPWIMRGTVRLTRSYLVWSAVALLGVVVLLIMVLAISEELGSNAKLASVEQMVSFVVERLDRKAPALPVDRGYDRLWKFPEYLLLGAGEAANHRWVSKSSFSGEIHSTLAAVLFYYGIPGLTLLVLFGINIVRWGTAGSYKWLWGAPVVYGLAHNNLRNWIAWIGLAILFVATRYEYCKHKMSDLACGEAEPARDLSQVL